MCSEVSPTPEATDVSSEQGRDRTMKKVELIEELLEAIRKKANRMTVKELEKMREKHEWITKGRKRSRK